MGTLITIVGKEGSGKKTLATNLAMLLAKDHLVGILDTSLEMAATQLLFGQRLQPEYSIGRYFADQKREDPDFVPFMEHAKCKNLFYTDIEANDSCLRYDQPNEDVAMQFWLMVKSKFDFIVVVAEQLKNDALSNTALYYSDVVARVVQPDVLNICWNKAHDALINDLNPSARVIMVCNADRFVLSLEDVQKELGVKFDFATPFSPNINRSSSEGKPIIHSASRKEDAVFLSELEQLALRISSPSGNEGISVALKKANSTNADRAAQGTNQKTEKPQVKAFLKRLLDKTRKQAPTDLQDKTKQGGHDDD